MIAAAAGLAALAGCTEEDDVRVTEASRWAVASAVNIGPPLNCVEQVRIRSHVALDERTIDFRLDDGTVMRNRLPFACPALLRTGGFTYRTAVNRLCSTDLITLVEPDGTGSLSCGLGLFQPVTIPPRPIGTVPVR